MAACVLLPRDGWEWQPPKTSHPVAAAAVDGVGIRIHPSRSADPGNSVEAADDRTWGVLRRAAGTWVDKACRDLGRDVRRANRVVLHRSEEGIPEALHLDTWEGIRRAEAGGVLVDPPRGEELHVDQPPEEAHDVHGLSVAAARVCGLATLRHLRRVREPSEEAGVAIRGEAAEVAAEEEGLRQTEASPPRPEPQEVEEGVVLLRRPVLQEAIRL